MSEQKNLEPVQPKKTSSRKKTEIEIWREVRALKAEKAAEERAAFIEKKAEELQYRRDRDRELVTGTFNFHECPGGKFDFVFRQYPGDDIEQYSFYDGHSYTIPLGVAKHLNNNCNRPKYEHVTLPGMGQGVRAAVNAVGAYNNGAVDFQQPMRVVGKIKRLSFQSNDFMGIDTLDPQVVVVESY